MTAAVSVGLARPQPPSASPVTVSDNMSTKGSPALGAETDSNAVYEVMGDLLNQVEEGVGSATSLWELQPVANIDPAQLETRRHRKKKRKHRDELGSRDKKRKRSLSCSTESSSCSTTSKKHKKKKKKHKRRDDPPSPRVNPIFLWVKQTNTTIVEVLCEDYDKRNRITLTKTAGGWRAIPRTERLSRQSSESGSILGRLAIEQPERVDTPQPTPQLAICQGSSSHDDEEDEDDPNKCHAVEETSDDHHSDQSEDEPMVIDETLEEDPSERNFEAGHELPEECDPLSSEVQPNPQEVPESSPLFLSPAEEDESGDEPNLMEIDEPIDETTEIGEVNSPQYVDKEYLEDPLHVEESIENTQISAPGNLVPIEDDHDDNLHSHSNLETEFDSISQNHLASEELQEKFEAEPPSPLSISLPSEEKAKEVIDGNKCCDVPPEMINLDENHNNEFDSDRFNDIMNDECLFGEGDSNGPSSDCGGSYENVQKKIEDIIGELERKEKDLTDERLKDIVTAVDPFGSFKGQLNSHGSSFENILPEINLHGKPPKTEIKEVKEENDDQSESLYKEIFNVDNPDISISMCIKKKEEVEDDPCPPPKSKTPIESKTSAEKPMNLVVQAKASDEIVPNDVIVIEDDNEEKPPPKSSDFADLDSIIWRLPEGTTIHQSKAPPVPTKKEPVVTPAAPKLIEKPLQPKLYVKPPPPIQEEPLNLGKPKPSPSPKLEPKAIKTRKPSLDDVTINPVPVKTSPKLEVKADITEAQARSRLLELLNHEAKEKCDPVAQLKEVLSDPDLIVPDPLLVPRARLPALIANPAKEIPRLLSQKQEELKYPKLDADMMVVSLAHLQSLLQNSMKDGGLKAYHDHTQLLQSQLKQKPEQTLDQATANALNQMLWLPYLTQMDMSKGQDLLSMLNMMFPPTVYGQNPYGQQWPQNIDYNTFNSQLQNQMATWQDLMQKPGFMLGNNNNMPSKPFETGQQYTPRTHRGRSSRGQSRTAQSYNGYQRTPQQHPFDPAGSLALATYPGMDPRKGKGGGMSSGGMSGLEGLGFSGTSHQSQRQGVPDRRRMPPPELIPRLRAPLLERRGGPPVERRPSPLMEMRPPPPPYHPQPAHSGRRLTPSPKGPSHVNRTPPPPPPQDTPRQGGSGTGLTSSTPTNPSVPKLKVKDHLVDPNSRPSLLKFADPATFLAGHPPGVPFPDEAHPHLWHPLFSNPQGKPYKSPWQWTTPVTVSGE